MPATASKDAIRTLPLFSGLAEQDKDILLKGGRMRPCKKGQLLFAHGDPVMHFYLICNGTMQLFRETPDGHEKTTDILIAGDTLGEREIFELSKTHQMNAMAVNDCTLLEFPVNWLRESAGKYGVFALNLLTAASQRSRRMEVDAEHMASMSAAQQVACFMQRICILHDLDPRGFELPYSKTLIASRLGIELETFSRTLTKLRDHGITIKGSHVIIDNLHAVEEYCCGHCSVSEECETRRGMEKKNSATEKKTSRPVRYGT